MTAVRVHHDTVRRGDLRLPPVAIASADADCPNCGRTVEANEPVVLSGAAVVRDPVLRVDVSDAEWVHQRCPTGGAS